MKISIFWYIDMHHTSLVCMKKVSYLSTEFLQQTSAVPEYYDDEKYMIIIMIIMEKNYHDTSEKYSMYSPFVFLGLFKSTSMFVQYHIFIWLVFKLVLF